MKKNRILTFATLALSLVFIGAFATTAGSQRVFMPQGPTGSMSETVRHPYCPNKLHMEISAKYPIKTGNAQVDAFFKKKAADFMAEKMDSGWLSFSGSCDISSNAFAYYDYLAYHPNDETLGVLTGFRAHEGGAHPISGYKTYNFDLRTGREIEIKDFFVNPRIGINGLYKFAYTDLCRETATHSAAQGFMGGQCGVDRDAPKKLLELNGSLDGLGHLVLTNIGVDLNFAYYEIWTNSKDIYRLSVPNNTLKKLGARNFWGLYAPTF
jgi:hypothetical protein